MLGGVNAALFLYEHQHSYPHNVAPRNQVRSTDSEYKFRWILANSYTKTGQLEEARRQSVILSEAKNLTPGR
jgi:hypothetical protein